MFQSKLVGGLENDAPIVAGGNLQWVLANSGDSKWPCSTTLRLIGGPIVMSPVVDVPELDPGQTVIIDLDVQATTECTSVFYTLMAPDGQPFGEILTAKVVPELDNFVQRPVCAVVDSNIMSSDKGLEALQGEVKVVEWTLANMGHVTWPEDAVATLIYNSPSLKDPPPIVNIPAIEPGMTVHVGLAVQMPEIPGHFKAMWAVHSPALPDFGETLYAEFNVSDFPFMEWMVPDELTKEVSSEQEAPSTASQDGQEVPFNPTSTSMLHDSKHRQQPYTCEVPGCGKCVYRSNAQITCKGSAAIQPSSQQCYMVSTSNQFAHLSSEDDEIEEEAVVDSSSDDNDKKLRQLPALATRRRGRTRKHGNKQNTDEREQMWRMEFEQFELMAESQRQARLQEAMDKQQLMNKEGQSDDDHESQHVPGEEMDKFPFEEEMEEVGDRLVQTTECESAPVGSCKSSEFQTGSQVEVRSIGNEIWNQGIVTSVDPLTINIGQTKQEEIRKDSQAQLVQTPEHDSPSFNSLSSSEFEIGNKVEMRRSDDQMWQQGTVASIEPLIIIAEGPPSRKYIGENCHAQENEPACLNSADSSKYEVGSKVEVRNTDAETWKQGTVASIDPLTTIVGDDMMAFEYQQVRSLGFEVGMHVEARNNEGQPWERGVVASGDPLTIFLGSNAMAFEYRYVRPMIGKKSSLSFSFWHVAVVALLLICHMIFGQSNPCPFVDLGLEQGKPSLLGKTWLSHAASNTSDSKQVNATITIQRMRELGHLRLSMSDCIGAERWFAQALAQAQVEGNPSLGDWSGHSVPENYSQIGPEEHMAMLGDRGFALVCAQRFQEGANMLNPLWFHAVFEMSLPHQVNALGYALFQTRKYNRAKEIFQAIVKNHGNNPVVWSNLAAASMLAGDRTTAEDAIYRALQLHSRLKPSVKDYYMQIFSNNYHILQETPSARGQLPWVELFNCMPQGVAFVANHKDPVEFQDTYAEVTESSKDEPLDTDQLLHSRSAVLALDPEPLFCP